MSVYDEIVISDGADPGDLIGYRADGRPIYAMGGGAENNFDSWVPEEYDSTVIQRVNQTSAMESLASRIPMGSTTKSTPRSSGVSVDFTAKGIAYNEDTSGNDDVVLTAKKFTRAIRIAEEDMQDSLANILAAKQKDWATSYAKAIDNASLAVTAAPGAGVPFRSVYYQLSQANGVNGYAANANIAKAGSAAPSYTGLNNAVGLIEVGDYFDESRIFAIAHPSFRRSLRGVLDGQQRPIFIDYGGADQGDVTVNGTLFGVPLKWSLGAKTSAVATSSPGGNPLIVFCNVDYLLLGIRSGPESAFAAADSGVGFLTDDAILKMRSRRGMNIGTEFAFSIFENNSGL